MKRENILFKANEIRRKKALDNKWLLYDFIDKNPNMTGYEISKEINWTVGKVKFYATKLVKDKMINNETEVENNRVLIRYSGKPMKDFINWEEWNKL
ncbi:hypothetical protein LCGC14_1279940 [marine sediment metagenome]|uniref:Winged helix-turn-helix domain-containing protein n=1 Tax=marine sediment metagenome TaxID=412755 RepID=A0A0F9KXC7_9ZZZZ|nr:MAG: hypothetical protein Lokiarch_38740 [Candidatus Lokiarchaeum sp. GC14_75]HDZ18416.1 hypothetical protein [archaeon]HEC40038.1 hypothetical protein [bacterium]